MTARVTDFNGWYEVPRNPISRVGVFPYSGRAIGKFTDGTLADPNRWYRVYRSEEELADPETIASFRLTPWTDDHPAGLLGDPEKIPGTIAPEAKGIQGVIGEQTGYDPATRTLFGNVKIFGAKLAALIDAGKKQLSCGFRCAYVLKSGIFEGQPYDAVQVRIRGNHIATVQSGRMGLGIAVLDAMQFALDASEAQPMKKNIRSRLMNALGVTDPAKLQEAIAANPQAFQAALDAEEDAPAAAAAGSDPKVSELIGMVEPLMKIATMIQSLHKAGEPDGDEAVPAEDDDMEPVLDAMGKPALDAFGKPQMKKKVAPAAAAAPAASGLDAMERRMKAAEAAISGFPKAPDTKALFKEVAARDALAGRLSGFVGAFDSSEMTLAEVAKYGVERLKLKNVPAGQEQTAVAAFLEGRTPPHRVAGFAFDAAPSASKNPFSDYAVMN